MNNHKVLIIVLIALLFPPNSFSQTGIIKGYVEDNIYNEPLCGANIIVNKTAMGSITDIDGNFIIKNIPAGVYDIHVRFIGYRDSVLTNIQVFSDSTINLYIDFPPYCKYNQKYNHCPICKKTDKVVPVVYGYPSKKLSRQARKGKVVLGGCIISDCDPKWYCKRDKKYF